MVRINNIIMPDYFKNKYKWFKRINDLPFCLSLPIKQEIKKIIAQMTIVVIAMIELHSIRY